MEPHLKPADKLLFYKYLKNASNYLEYGSGGSTYQAFLCTNIDHIISVESDQKWIDKIQNEIDNTNNIKNADKINFKFIDMKIGDNGWGHPGIDSTKEERAKYSNVICELDKEIVDKIDLILIDGRFRVACALKCFSKIKEDCFIIFDDFLERNHYHIILDYYDIIEKTSNNSMVVLKKKNCEGPSDELIKKYEDKVE